jgi:FkbM family methyltransferase
MQINTGTANIKKFVKFLIKKSLQFFDLTITSNSDLVSLRNELARMTSGDIDLAFLREFEVADSGKFFHLLSSSKSQFHQDLFVLSELNFKEGGYFVEFGATNGVDLSNSYLLEKNYSWKGILAEPARIWHKELRSNRQNSIIETSCVWKKSNETLWFNETDSPELSTLDIFSDSDSNVDLRKSGNKYQVSTISLGDLLEKHRAPKDIDYLSIDTEGSEFEILNSFNFDKYNIRIISCEHNFTKNRNRIYSLLRSKGYERKFESISRIDDWYVKIT